MGYRFVGSTKHSAVKVCEWCKKAIRGENVCYKQKFYGIASHRCVQMTPTVFACTENCVFCWRTIEYKKSTIPKKWDKPEMILGQSIEMQKTLLQGFGGNKKVERIVFEEALNPKHVAISLAGEPTLYPYLPELIDEIRKNSMSSFLVTNGTSPKMIKKLVNHQPTQLYITLAAPNKELLKKISRPIFDNAWEHLLKSLDILHMFKRSVIRLTLVKGMNMVLPEKYAELIELATPTFVEVKAFMSIGGARKRLPITNMPFHSQIRGFSKSIEKHSSYRIVNEKQDSRVVLLAKDEQLPFHTPLE